MTLVPYSGIIPASSPIKGIKHMKVIFTGRRGTFNTASAIVIWAITRTHTILLIKIAQNAGKSLEEIVQDEVIKLCNMMEENLNNQIEVHIGAEEAADIRDILEPYLENFVLLSMNSEERRMQWEKEDAVTMLRHVLIEQQPFTLELGESFETLAQAHEILVDGLTQALIANIGEEEANTIISDLRLQLHNNSGNED